MGGINPKAVEAALTLGGRKVWLLTVDSACHAQVHGSIGRYDVHYSQGSKRAEVGISVVKNGELTAEARMVCELVAEHDAILGTCHQSYEELKIIVPAACAIGVRKILLTHPFFRVPDLTLEQTQELVGLGAMAESGYCTVSPQWAYATIRQKAAAIRTLGAERCVLISDAGQRHNPIPPEALRVFVQGLFEAGISEAELDTMIRCNPAQLLGGIGRNSWPGARRRTVLCSPAGQHPRAAGKSSRKLHS